MRILYFDVETYSALDLTKVGSYLYARHASTDIRCLSYCLTIDGERGPIETWMPGAPVPQTFIDVAADPATPLCAFNDTFDRQIYEQILVPRYGWPAIPLERHRCAQAATLARALPASLDAAATALKIATRKNPDSVATMKRLAGPRRQSAKERKAGKPLDFSATPEELATLAEYNRIDVLMMMEIVDRIGLLPSAEQAIWELDQRINERGVHVDVSLLEAGLGIAEEAGRELGTRLAELTDGRITTPKQVPRIKRWLAEHGCALSNLRKGTVADACLSGCHPQPLAVVFGHAHGRSPAWQSSVPTIAPRVPATFSRRRGLRRLPGEGSLERRVCLPPLSGGGRAVPLRKSSWRLALPQVPP